MEYNPDLCYKVSIFGMRSARRLEDGSIRRGYFNSPEEAQAAHDERQKEIQEQIKKHKADAERLLDLKEKQYKEFLAAFMEDGSNIWPDAEASDDTGMETYMHISVNVGGFEYTRKIYD